MNPTRRWSRHVLACLAPLVVVLSACGGGGGGDGGSTPTARFTLGGSISGLNVGGLVLANGTDTVAPAAGATGFTLPTSIASGSVYSISVRTQPTGLTCSVANGSGTMGNANVNNAVVTCSANAFTLGGSISGLTGNGLVLANGSDTLAVAAGSTTFTLPAAVASGSGYSVTVKTQPIGQTCAVAGGNGTMGNGNVTGIGVSCGANSFTLGGSITGLVTSGLVLANGNDTLAVAANASSFTLPTAVAFGASYSVSVRTQPTGLTCSVANGSGTMGAANVGNVTVTCSANAFTLGGSISGLAQSGLVLATGSDTLAVAANATSFTFPTPIAFGSAFSVSVQAQPTGLTCTVSNGGGTMGAANVGSVVVTCSANSFTLGGTISGLTSGGLVLANGSDTLTVAANASSFTMPTAVAFGSPYNVTVKTQPQELTCSVTNGSGTMGAANVSNVTVSCVAASFVTVSTFAGTGTAGSADGTGTAASFRNPQGVAFDASGNLFVADTGNNKIRKITPAGVVSTLAGSGTAGGADGTGTAASFNYPRGMAVDASGNLFVADRDGNKIRKITPAGVVTTFAGSGTAGSADGTGTAASFNGPSGLAIDAAGTLYVADQFNNKIRKITSAGVVTTFAGSGTAADVDGVGPAASFSGPGGIALGSDGILYVGEVINNLRKITTDATVSTLATKVTSGSVLFGIAPGASGNLYLTDLSAGIYKVSPAGVVTRLIDNNPGDVDGALSVAKFHTPIGIVFDSSGNLFVADSTNNKIRKIARD